jgi:hypothetical protein
VRAYDEYLLPFSCIKLNMVRHVGGHGLRDTPAKGRRGTDRVDAEAQEAGADPFPYSNTTHQTKPNQTLVGES